MHKICIASKKIEKIYVRKGKKPKMNAKERERERKHDVNYNYIYKIYILKSDGCKDAKNTSHYHN